MIVPYSALSEYGYDEDDIRIGAILRFEHMNTIWHGCIEEIDKEKDEVTYFAYWPL